MYTVVKEDELNIFNKPSRVILFGVSGAGKSSLTSALLHKYHSTFQEIIVLGSDLENISELNVRRDDNFTIRDITPGKKL